MDEQPAATLARLEQERLRRPDELESNQIGYIHYKPLLDAFVECLQQALGARLVSVVLYGSIARGTARPDSDIDMLVVIEEDRDQDGKGLVRAVERELERTSVYAEARQRHLGCSISSLVLTRAAANQNRYLYLDMTREARLLFDRDDFFKTRLVKMQARMKELGSARIELPDGTWYWIVKADMRVGEVFEL